MKKIKVTRSFTDRETLKFHAVDEVIEREEARANELITRGYAIEVVEAIEEVVIKKNKSKKNGL